MGEANQTAGRGGSAGSRGGGGGRGGTSGARSDAVGRDGESGRGREPQGMGGRSGLGRVGGSVSPEEWGVSHRPCILEALTPTTMGTSMCSGPCPVPPSR